jgi:site-specific recombinase XerD
MNNKFPQIHLIYNRYKKASADKQAVVEIRVTHNYQQKYISTGVWLYPYQWDKGKIINCDNIIEISKTLDKMVTDVKQVIYEMIEEKNIDIMQISSRLDAKNKLSMTFIDFCKQRAVIRKYGKEKDTQERYDRFIRRFSQWGKIKTFDDIRDDKIIAYDRYLIGEGMKPYSKWNNYHRFLNGFIIDAIKEGLLKRNPYQWINIDKNKNSLGLDKCLTPKEFKQLKEAPMPTRCLERVRDLFVFQTYTCLRYSDLASFDYRNISIINGTNVYKCKQKKTKKYATIPLLKTALDILSKYKGILPVISNVRYNAHLKVVAQAAGLSYNLSTHWARHTGATILLNEGVDMKIVSRICGHSSTRITEQIYAKLLDETIINAIKEKENNFDK